MKILKIALLTFFLFGISSTSNAQFWKKLKKKVQDKVEQRVEKEVEKGTDKAIDDVLSGKKREEEIKKNESTEMPKFTGGSGILKLYDFGYEYVTEDITISVYGKFDENNLSKSVKTYHEDRVIHPVDAYPEGYALAYNKGGFLDRKGAHIIIHHADTKKVVYSLKGSWNTADEKKPVSASYVSLNITNIIDKKSKENSSENKNNTTKSTNNNDIYLNEINVSDADVKIPDTFKFSSSLEMEITSNKADPIKLEYFFSKRTDIYAMSLNVAQMGTDGSMINVVTPNGITMFMEMSGMKIKKSVSKKQLESYNFKDKMPENMESIKKTGNTKTILGFYCEEYKYTNKNDEMLIWMAEDFPIKRENFPMFEEFDDNIFKGFVLEMNMKNGKEEVQMKVINFDKNKNFSINTKEYKSLGF